MVDVCTGVMDVESGSTETIVCPRCESAEYVSLHKMTVQYRLPAEWFRCDVCGHLFSKPRHKDSLLDRISEPGWWVLGAALAGATWLSWQPDVIRLRHLFAQGAQRVFQHGAAAAHASR